MNELDDYVLMRGEQIDFDNANENLLNTTVDSHIANDFNSVNGGVSFFKLFLFF